MESKGDLSGLAQDRPLHDIPIEQRQAETLPASFAYHYTESPKTPEPRQQSHDPQPPKPPKVRIRRRRPRVLSYDGAADDEPSYADVLPSIEVSGDLAPLSIPEPLHVQKDLLSPISSPHLMTRLGSPPKTPLHQINTSQGEGFTRAGFWSPTSPSEAGASITRPSSTFSNSSVSTTTSSVESFDYVHPTSPDSDGDPFFTDEGKRGLSASANIRARPAAKRQKRHRDVKWTQEMDNHIWLTYIAYLSDPTVTPFKTLPGTAPPLGVCVRVAREARRSWKNRRVTKNNVEGIEGGPFASLDTIMHNDISGPTEGAGSPDTIRPDTMFGGFSEVGRRGMFQWPRSECSTRKRLRELCKHKSALSPHYQRLMQSRSPSPIESSSSRPRFSSPHTVFSTRSMHVNLATSTARTMQPGNPLQMLHYRDVGEEAFKQRSSPRTPPRPQRRSPARRSPRTNAHQKSQSLQSGLVIGHQRQHHRQPQRQSARQAPYLRSPFHEQSNEPPAPPFLPMPIGPIRAPAHDEQMHSPLELHHPRPQSNSMKRRAECPLGEELLSEDPEIRREWLNTMFDDPDGAVGNRRVRRGFSLGAGRAGLGDQSRHLADILAAYRRLPAGMPRHQQEAMHGAGARYEVHQQPFQQPFQPVQPVHSAQTHGLDPGPRPARYLRSPFEAAGTDVGLSNTFPRSIVPQGLEDPDATESEDDTHRGGFKRGVLREIQQK